MRGPWPRKTASLRGPSRRRSDLRDAPVVWGEGSLQDSEAVVTIPSIVTSDSSRDGGEKTAVTRTVRPPASPAVHSAPCPPPPRRPALPSSDSGLGGQGGSGRRDQRCRRA
ncbi:Stabilin-1 [Manis pentadactyla]|nr:Stabilin-1 [Manis pentadactyla]